MRKVVLVFLLIGGLIVRLYRINSPVADWHSWRQADTAAVARNFLRYGYDFLHPTFDDLSSLPSGKDNPLGYRFVEFPIFNAFHAAFYQAVCSFKVCERAHLSFETIGRLSSVFFSLAAGYLLFLIVKTVVNWKTAVTAMAFYLFLPFSIYYSRTILPDQAMITLALGSVFFLLKCHPAENFSLGTREVISLVLGAISLLIKPYALFILLPVWLFIFGKNFFLFRDKESRIRLSLKFSFYSTLVFLPFLLWRWWMQSFPEGIPSSLWLLNFAGIRLRPAWWRWLFFERIGKLILGGWGLVLLGFGIADQSAKKEVNGIFYAWILGIMAYFTIFAGGNVTHDYYQVITVPAISVFLAKGFISLLTIAKRQAWWQKFFTLFLAIGSTTLMAGFSWYQIKEYYKINRPEIIEAGRFINENTPKDAKVIAPYNGDTAFLYQTQRKGWPIKNRNLYDLIQMGASYYVSVNPDSIDEDVKDKCQIMKSTPQWIVYDLKTCR